jgi:ferredoxin-NADP reductase
VRTLALVPGKVHEATVMSVAPIARDILEARFVLDQPLPFRPGQFISLRVGKDQNGDPILRSYSIASPPAGSELSIVLKVIPGGAGSEWFRRLVVGQQVEFTGPMGFFVLELAHPGDVVLGATGVGIAPVLPMLDELLARPEPGRVYLYWGSRHKEELFWQRELAERQAKSPRLEAHTYLSGPAPGWSGRRGRITKAVLDDLERFQQPTFYLVGNGAMVRELKGELQARGIDRKRQIRNEIFFP